MFEKNFIFNTNQFDFWPIYESIKRYYPIGINRSHEGMYSDYLGHKKLEKLLIENIHENYGEFKQKLNAWEKALNNRFVGTTYGQEPSFSAYMELEKNSYKDWILEKRLYFAISLIGPYYTIYGMDTSTLLAKAEYLNKNRQYHQCNRLIISPYIEFHEDFEKLRKLLEEKYPDYKFVPYHIYSSELEGLQLNYADNLRSKIFYALFNQQIDFDVPIAGDQYEYGYDQWRIRNTKPSLSP